MAISDLLNRRVRAQTEDDEEEVYSEESAEGGSSNESGSASGAGSGASDEGSDDEADSAASAEDTASDDGEDSAQDSDQNDDTDIQSSINNISFGALARAQESLGAKPKKKSRKLANASESPDPSHHDPSPLDDMRERIRQAREHKQTQKEKEKKASKHAPTVQSSKRAVTRKRPVVDLPSVPKARDPRFDPTILSQNSNGAGKQGNSAYSFLDEYRASELKDLKARLAKTKDPEQKEALKREVRSAGDRMRSIENKRREEDVKARHKSEEKRLIREGKKSAPYYLKKSELRQQALVRKYQDMGSRERAKALERRRKKAASKERKEMPMERRGVGGDDATGDSGRKRKRMA